MLGIIATLATTVVSIITSVTASVGPVIARMATAIATHLPEIEKAIGIIGKICEVIGSIAQLLGILQPEEEVDEVGAKAMQEGVKSRTDFESTQAYIEYLRKEVELDRELFNQMDDEKKIACAVLGTAITTEALSEKLEIHISPEFIESLEKEKMSPSEIKSCMETFSEKGLKKLDLLTGYIEGNDLKGKEVEVDIAIAEAIQKAHVEYNEQDVTKRMLEISAAE